MFLSLQENAGEKKKALKTEAKGITLVASFFLL
jgi:hypothetical protein